MSLREPRPSIPRRCAHATLDRHRTQLRFCPSGAVDGVVGPGRCPGQVPEPADPAHLSVGGWRRHGPHRAHRGCPPRERARTARHRGQPHRRERRRGAHRGSDDAAGVQVAANSEWRTLKQLLDYVKANPGKAKASGTGRGGSWDLARVGMLKTAGIPIDALPWVPSTGAATGLQELVAGGVQVVTASLVEGRPLIEAGKVRALANMADKRDPGFPDVPTLKELGINWTMGAWRGIALPKGASPEIVAALEKALDKVVKSPEYVDFMNKGPFGILYKGSADFGKFLAEQDQTMGVLMKEAGLTK